MSSFAEYSAGVGGFGGNYILLSPGSGIVVGPIQNDWAENIVGAIVATVSGVGLVQQSFDGGQTWDVSNTVVVTSGTYTYNIPSYGNTSRLVYTNGSGLGGQSGYFRAVIQAKTTAGEV